jgi:malonyl-CoA O-methyltransferase
MKVQTQFSRHADHYGHYNVIQRQVVKKLLGDLETEPEYILDLGCGEGALYEALPWKPKYFIGVDFAPGMLELHPKKEGVECVYGDFDDPGLFEHLQYISFDHIFSASALQWSHDLEHTFANIASLNAPVSFAIFTSNTFKSLFKTASVDPVLRSVEEVKALAELHFNADYELVNYTLGFDSVREMFRYIKRSGVSGGRSVLSYKDTKRLMREYPFDYLEFEVLFIRS